VGGNCSSRIGWLKVFVLFCLCVLVSFFVVGGLLGHPIDARKDDPNFACVNGVAWTPDDHSFLFAAALLAAWFFVCVERGEEGRGEESV